MAHSSRSISLLVCVFPRRSSCLCGSDALWDATFPDAAPPPRQRRKTHQPGATPRATPASLKSPALKGHRPDTVHCTRPTDNPFEVCRRCRGGSCPFRAERVSGTASSQGERPGLRSGAPLARPVLVRITASGVSRSVSMFATTVVPCFGTGEPVGGGNGDPPDALCGWGRGLPLRSGSPCLTSPLGEKHTWLTG
jgi:hypothetical protein